MPPSRILRASAALALLVAAGAGGGCAGKRGDPRAPEQAYLQLLDAADAGDGAMLFDALDTRTRWAIETVHKAQREVRKLIIESYPPAERDAALARLPAACEEELERPRRYYRRLDDTAAALADLKRRLYLGTGQPIGSVRKDRGEAEVWRAGGSVFRFARDDKGRWGFSELREGWERARERSLHEVETVRENAALYKRRAGSAPASDTATAKGTP